MTAVAKGERWRSLAKTARWAGRVCTILSARPSRREAGLVMVRYRFDGKRNINLVCEEWFREHFERVAEVQS